jgi:hypothetical protein
LTEKEVKINIENRRWEYGFKSNVTGNLDHLDPDSNTGSGSDKDKAS